MAKASSSSEFSTSAALRPGGVDSGSAEMKPYDVGGCGGCVGCCCVDGGVGVKVDCCGCAELGMKMDLKSVVVGSAVGAAVGV